MNARRLVWLAGCGLALLFGVIAASAATSHAARPTRTPTMAAPATHKSERSRSRHRKQGATRVITPGMTIGDQVSMSTITPYQLTQMHVELLTPTATPSISAAGADATAETIFSGDPVEETVQANCVMLARMPSATIPCWVVSLQPPPVAPLAGDDPGTYADAPFTVEMVLVDSETGDLIEGYQAGYPATAPAH